VALSGGVFMNRILNDLLTPELEAMGLQVLRHRRTPPGDGGIALGQTVVAPTLRLVEGKPALVLAQVVSDTPGLSNVVQVVGRRAGQELGRVTMTGPATVPTTAVDPTRQFRATVPAEWIRPGLELTVRADAMETLPESSETNNEARLTPAVLVIGTTKTVG
jgi:hypothetical protein